MPNPIDPLSIQDIGASHARPMPSQMQLNPTTAQVAKQLADNAHHAHGAELHTPEEEPAVHDHLDVALPEAPPEMLAEEEAGMAGSLSPDAQHAAEEHASAQTGSTHFYEQHATGELEGGTPFHDAEMWGEEMPPQGSQFQSELEQTRAQFESQLSNTPNSILGRNQAGMMAPFDQMTDGAAPGGGWNGGGKGGGFFGGAQQASNINEQTDSFSLRGLFGGGPNPGCFPGPRPPGSGMSKLMKGLLIGGMALTAFTPLLFAGPLMMSPLGMGGLGSAALMLTPMLSGLSLNMMMMMNMFSAPPLPFAMTQAMGPMPYPYPMQNPYFPGGGGGDPSQMYGPQYGPQGPNGPQRPRRVVSALGTEGPVESQLVNGPQSALSPAAQSKLQGMSPDKRKQFQDLFDKYNGQYLMLPGRPEKLSVSDNLASMLESGRLESKDKYGHDLLDNLTTMNTQNTNPGLNQHLLTAQGIVQTAQPAHTMTQGDHGTCAASTVQYMLADQRPAEYIRLANGITGQQGRVDMASGKELTLVGDSIPEDKSGRTALDRVMQASFMNVEGGQSGQYSNQSDSFHNNGSFNPFHMFHQEQGGLLPQQVQSLASDAMGEPYVQIYQQGQQDPRQAVGMIDNLTRNGQPVPVSMNWDGGGHRILVTKVENGQVYYRNPWGQRNGANAGEVLQNANNQIYQDGFESMSVEAFMERMRSAIAPARMMQGGS